MPLFFGSPDRSPGADRLQRSLEKQGITNKANNSEEEGQVDAFLRQLQAYINLSKVKTPAWVNWVFVPLIITGFAATLFISFDKGNSEKIRTTSLAGCISMLTAAIGFYAGKK